MSDSRAQRRSTRPSCTLLSLLVILIVGLNLTAIRLRGRLSASTAALKVKTMSETVAVATPETNQSQDSVESCLNVNDLSLYYGDSQALADINLDIATKKVTAFIGPSGCGKSTLRCFNRMNDLIDDVRYRQHRVRRLDIYDSRVDVAELRRSIGMVFQRPNPFPKSIYENVAYGLRIQGERSTAVIDERVEWALKSAALWEEVKDRLKDSALGLLVVNNSLVIARAIAIKPSVLLLDEPASALDPISTLKIEEPSTSSKTITPSPLLPTTCNKPRVSDYTAFLYLGEMVEYGQTDDIFRNREKRTEDYITGRYG